MARTKPHGPIDINELVEKLDSARNSLAHEANKDYYLRHHDERSGIDSAFDDLVDWVRAHQSAGELAELVKPVSDPDLQPGDLVLLDGAPATVREISIHKAHTHHQDSRLPQHQPAMEIVTGRGSQWYALAPVIPRAT
ncbi:hypothetical protein [Streptomyces yaizuensis]|uniref:Uncharacterized protein n=1 Tax=Streptomyces yaizuensis TaxID=2989713 RepID=A0ABQ5P613_9ACTN|nr:hypothetical protein [Streptomyces sp. YSPA8]GLF98021.1 hypothetical protein SYYSPA8_27010 [Streptomyces sp. YSPA8]